MQALFRTRGRRLAALTTVLLCLVAAGGAYAIIPDSSGVIHGCYAKNNGGLRVIDTDTGANCSSSEKAIAWSASGPSGPAGASGPSGPAGASGASGAAGASGPSGPGGASGPSGPAGASGPSGAAGASGPSGAVGASGPSGPKGGSGPSGPQGEPGITLWAYVGITGNLIRGSHAVSAHRFAEGAFSVTFDRDVSECGATASPVHLHHIGVFAGLPNDEDVEVGISDGPDAADLVDDLFYVIVAC